MHQCGFKYFSFKSYFFLSLIDNSIEKQIIEQIKNISIKKMLKEEHTIIKDQIQKYDDSQYTFILDIKTSFSIIQDQFIYYQIIWMNFAKAIGVGALSLLALGGWRLLENFRKQTKLPSKQETLLILQTIRFEFYPVLVKIADLVVKELMPRGVKPEQNQKFVMADPEIKELIQSINQKIYVKFTEEEVKQSADIKFREDGDIIKQKHAFRQQYQKSLLGVRPDKEMIASRKINKGKVLEVIKDILTSNSLDYEDKIQRLSIQRLQTLNQEDQRVILQSDIEQDQRVTKQKIKEQLGLYAKDSIQIFHFIVARYKSQDQSFASSYDAIIKQYQQKVRAIIPL